jgi:hypothetical protein
MAIYEKIEFLKLCGLDTSVKSNKDKFSVWISRGKIVLNKDGLVDDTIPQNRDWILRQQEVAGSNQKQHENIEVDQPKKVSRTSNIDAPEDGVYNLDKKLKTQQLAKLTVDTRLAELKEEKIRGEVIPIDLVNNIFMAHTQSIITANRDGIEDLLINISKEHSLSRESLANLRGKLIKILNSATDKAVDMTKRNLKSIIEEFSIKKEVGERD